MDILLFCYILLIVSSCFSHSGKDNDYLYPDNTNALRGIASIGIVLHHMSERTIGGIAFRILPITGYLLVAFFFFLSGFGLLTQYKIHGDTYLKGFLKKRVGYLAIIYLLDIAVYAVWGLINGAPYTFRQIICSVWQSGIAANAWYMIVLIISYLSFFCIFRFAKRNSTSQKITLFFFSQLVVILLYYLSDYDSYWYVSNLAFTLGMVWAHKKGKIDALLQARYIKYLIIVCTLFCFFYAAPWVVEHTATPSGFAMWFRTLCRLISTPLSVAVEMVLIFKLKPKMRLWDRIGKISLEIYLIHGLVWSILRSSYVYIENELAWTALTIVVSILAAIPVSYLNKFIARRLRG